MGYSSISLIDFLTESWLVISNFISSFKDHITFLLALIVALIAYQQFIINRSKLKLDLFDKRYKVLENLRQLMASVLQTGDVDEKILEKYRLSIFGAEFIYDYSINNYLWQVYRMGNRMLRLKNRINNSLHPPETTKFIKEKEDLFDWFVDQFESLDDKFNYYLVIIHETSLCKKIKNFSVKREISNHL
jgi:hypothetical protein